MKHIKKFNESFLIKESEQGYIEMLYKKFKKFGLDYKDYNTDGVSGYMEINGIPFDIYIQPDFEGDGKILCGILINGAEDEDGVYLVGLNKIEDFFNKKYWKEFNQVDSPEEMDKILSKAGFVDFTEMQDELYT